MIQEPGGLLTGASRSSYCERDCRLKQTLVGQAAKRKILQNPKTSLRRWGTAGWHIQISLRPGKWRYFTSMTHEYDLRHWPGFRCLTEPYSGTTRIAQRGSGLANMMRLGCRRPDGSPQAP